MNLYDNSMFKDDPLCNFGDLAERTKVMNKGLNSDPLDFNYVTTIKLSGIDDLVIAVEQDYYLNRLITPKLHYIHNDKELLEKTIHLTEMYVSASTEVGSNAEKVKRYALSNLNLI